MEPLISVRIRAALSGNPECRPGLLARGRVAYAGRGRLSHGNGRELFCLVRHYTWPGILDMRCMNVYGLGTAYFKDPCEEGFRPRPQPPAAVLSPQPHGESA